MFGGRAASLDKANPSKSPPMCSYSDPMDQVAPDETHVGWIWRGVQQHAEAAQRSEAVDARLRQLDCGLEIVVWAIQTSSRSVAEVAAGNEVAALACYTRAFRSLRAAALLATDGLYHEARTQLRDVYESAGLARMLAKRPDKADEWLVRQRWVKDNEVRDYIEKLVLPNMPAEDSPYRAHYRDTCEVLHPTARSTLPLVWSAADARFRPRLQGEYDETELSTVLLEIAAEAVFVGFTILRAAGDESWAPPEWRQALYELAADVLPGTDLSHLHRDWVQEERNFQRIQSAVLRADQIEEAISTHPNSQRNVRLRAGPDADAEQALEADQ